MTVLLCPPKADKSLRPEAPVPHPGFGATYLFRRIGGHVVLVWDADDRYEDDVTVEDLTSWLVDRWSVLDPVVWTLIEHGPMVENVWSLFVDWNDGAAECEWRHVLARRGFA